MPPKGMEIVQCWRLRENIGSMEFAETNEVSRRSPRELKFVRYIIRLEDLTKSFKWAYVLSGGVPTRLHAQYLPHGKEKLLLRNTLSLKRRSCLPPPALYSDWIARSKYYGGIPKQMNFNYPRRWNQWKHWAKWHRLGNKCDRLHICTDILASNVANKLLQFALRGEWGNWEKLFLSCGRFHSLLVAFRNSKTHRHSEMKQTRPSTKQDFSGEALSK